MLEQSRVARAHPITKVYRKNGGSYGYSGYVVNIAQTITSITIATSLLWNSNSENASNIVIQPPGDGE